MRRVNEEDIDFDETEMVFYEGEPFTGEVVETDRAGNIVAAVAYNQGYRHGPWREWHSNGNLLIEGRVEFGKGPVGTWKKWHKNGALAEERRFDDHGRTLSIREWDENGALTVDEAYSKPV
ncbi:toxin-antitoxin system YwqK family antitoxin [Streptomonospora algeriensis]|uniref:Toxin-antitoxin system YwqK family antitoxin n=1 Tax=Streptomonospora algeriensis TaxID=995084 RepID=A0ABW3BFH9_9ACTN